MSRSAKTHKNLMDSIADALIEIMKEKPFDKITVDEIIEKSNAGRMTYFRNFSSKQDVLTYKLIQHWEKEAAKRDLQERNKFDINNAQDFFEINYLLKDLYDLIYKSGLQSVVFVAFNNIMLLPKTNNVHEHYRNKFYCYGLFGLLDTWICGGYKETPQEMADMMIDIVQINKSV